MLARCFVLLSVVTAIVSACSPEARWGLTAYNNHTAPVLVRVDSDAGSGIWLLRPGQIDNLMVGDRQAQGSVTLVNPETCEVLATQSFGREPGLLVLFDRGVTANGPWNITVGVESPADTPPIAPIEDRCLGG